MPPYQKGKLSQHPTCENCIHTIRKNGEQDTVVCVQHLKDMPGDNFLVCELHTMKSQMHEES
jgi:hypothetical protein